MTIKQIQTLLCYFGLLEPKDIDNAYGSKTAVAVKAFQRRAGISADGIPGTNTQKMLIHCVAYGFDQEDTAPENAEWPFKHFTRAEFACKDGCGFDTINPICVEVCEDARHAFGDRPYTISSGCRCKKHNSSLRNSSPKSWHMDGDAVDGAISGVSSARLCNYMRMHPKVYSAYAIDNDFVHFQVKR